MGCPGGRAAGLAVGVYRAGVMGGRWWRWGLPQHIDRFHADSTPPALAPSTHGPESVCLRCVVSWRRVACRGVAWRAQAIAEWAT